MKVIQLRYGAAEPLVLEIDHALMGDLAGPPGATGAAAERLVTETTTMPPTGPPLSAHAVPGDRVVIAVSGRVPQAAHVMAALTGQLTGAGVALEDISILHAGGASAGLAVAQEFHGNQTAETAYLGADGEGRPLHLARRLVDADLVVTVGEWAFDAALGGRSLEGELWPAFGREECGDELAADLARRGRRALPPWREKLRTLTWQLGVTACLRIVAGRDGTVAAATFGIADSAARRARAEAHAWEPTVQARADLAVCSLSATAENFGAVVRGVAAAARITRPGGTICIATTSAEPPGPVVTRWRQGAPLRPIVREALASGDRGLVADAAIARLLARSLDDYRLVLLSGLDETTVEDLEFGFAATPETVERLAHRAESVVVLHEADRLFPHIA